MVDFKEKWREAKDYFDSMPPLVKAFLVLVLGTIPIDVLSLYMGWVNKAELEGLKNLIRQSDIGELVISTLVTVPVQEEVLYRGPARILIFFFPNLTAKNPFTWLAVLVPTYYWAAIAGGGGHGIPLDALLAGIVFGWCVIETKSLETAIVFHSLYNAMGLIGALIKYRFL